jgi:hypothetical protein
MPAQINKVEREIYAVKTNIRAIKARKWTHENYSDTNPEMNFDPIKKDLDLTRQLTENETRLHNNRQKLAKLLIQFYNIKIN